MFANVHIERLDFHFRFYTAETVSIQHFTVLQIDTILGNYGMPWKAWFEISAYLHTYMKVHFEQALGGKSSAYFKY